MNNRSTSPRIYRLIALLPLLLITRISFGQDTDTALETRSQIDRELVQSLTEIANQAGEAADQVRSCFVPRDPSAVTLFLPRDDSHHQDALEALPAPISKRLEDALSRHAQQLFQHAQLLVETDETSAYQLLFEVLDADPKHAAAGRILQSTLPDLRPNNASEQKPTLMRQRERTYGWAPRAWHRVDSPHFFIITNADPAAIEELLEHLETLYAVWDQTFFGYWSPPGRLARAFEDKEPLYRPRSKKHSVVVFASRDDYVRQVAGLAPNAEQSKGYYALQRRQSLFYLDADEPPIESWIHETTHQLFQERIQAKLSVGDRSNFWLVEGIAMLMESTQDHGRFATVGGQTAGRLQYARFNVFSSQFFRPLEEFVAMGQNAYQRDSQVRRLYSQAAGMSQWLMTAQKGAYRPVMIDLLRDLYRSQIQPDDLFQTTGRTADQLNREYLDFLRPRKALLSLFPPQGQLDGLSLAYGDIDGQALSHLADVTSLKWLDLSHCELTDNSLKAITHIENVEQLFLAATPITDRSLLWLKDFKNLRELDLSQTQIRGTELKVIAALPQLEALSLANTQVDDQTIAILAQCQSLRTLNLEGTQVTQQGLNRLKTALPNLR